MIPVSFGLVSSLCVPEKTGAMRTHVRTQRILAERFGKD